MTIAFTGATGQFGRLLADALLERTDAANLIALARTPERAKELADKGIEVREFDYDQPDGLAQNLRGVERLLLVSGSDVGRRVPQHKAVIDAAVEAGVGLVAYTGFLHAEAAKLIAVAPEHRETEDLLAAAPFSTVLLQNGWYAENFEPDVKNAIATATYVTSAGDGRVSSATRAEYAEAAAILLTRQVLESGTYELAGDVAWSFAELVEAIGAASGKPVALSSLSTDEKRAALIGAGVPDGVADFMVGVDRAIAAGELQDPHPGTLSTLLGHPTASLESVISSWLA